MRNGFLCGLLLLFGARTAHAQNWPYPAYYSTPYYPPGYAWPQPYYHYPAPYAVPQVLPVPARPNQTPMARPVSLPDPKVTPVQAPVEAPVEAPEAVPETDVSPMVDMPVVPSQAPAVADGGFFRPSGRHEKWWLGAGYLAAWLRPASIPIPLVTTGSPNDNPPGALGQPSTGVLFGNDSVNYGTLHGGYFELGFWLDPDDRCSLELGAFGLLPTHVTYSASSDANGSPTITRPVFGAIGQTEAAFVDALPGVAAGGTLIDLRSLLVGGEVNARYHWYCLRRLHADVLLGFRSLHFEEGLDINDRIQPLQANSFTFLGNVVNPPNSLADMDHFKALNTFYGVNFGARLRWEHELCFIDVYGKIAPGVNSQIVNIGGSSNLISPNGSAASAPGGLLALPTNIGEHSRRQFGYVREAGFNLGFDPLAHLRFKVGYSFLAWSGVTRPGDALDRVVNPRQVPTDQTFGLPGTGARPAFVFVDELLWVHFLNVGMELHW